MKLSHCLVTACLLAVPLSCLAADPVAPARASAPASAPGAAPGAAPSEIKLMGAWQAVTVTPGGLGGRETLEPKRNDSILEFQPGHELRLHAPCGSRRDGLVARGESLYVSGSWSLAKDGKLRIQAAIGGKDFDEAIPVRMIGDRMQFVNGVGKQDEFVRYTAPLPVQCE